MVQSRMLLLSLFFANLIPTAVQVAEAEQLPQSTLEMEYSSEFEGGCYVGQQYYRIETNKLWKPETQCVQYVCEYDYEFRTTAFKSYRVSDNHCAVYFMILAMTSPTKM